MGGGAAQSAGPAWPLSWRSRQKRNWISRKLFFWYEDRRSGLGEDFLTSVDASIESIRRQPEMYPIVHEIYRRALTRRFPYAVFYEYDGATATIYAVFHTSRDPAKWLQRLPSRD